ncbi:MucR family transcriptional regulator [Nocardioidaceae bacterium]|nr:MucR family transcriptional regulator [Nocardioidaceae bacterium]
MGGDESASAVEPHLPCGRLPDGAWLFAPFGEVLVTNSGRSVVCHACGDALAAVSAGHLRRHGLSLAGYRERFGLNRKTSLVAPALAQVRREEGARRWADNVSVREGLAVGQAMARSGELHDLGVAAQPAGSRRSQGRVAASSAGASGSLRSHRRQRSESARLRWTEAAAHLGFESLEAYLDDRRGQDASAHRVRKELGCGGSAAARLLRGAAPPGPGA